jgi:hypothetical protein
MKALQYNIQSVGSGSGMVMYRLARIDNDESIPKFIDLSDWMWME